MISFDCKRCRHHRMEAWELGRPLDEHDGICYVCKSKAPQTVEHVRVRQDREECAAVGVLVVPLVIMACAVILAILMGAPQ